MNKYLTSAQTPKNRALSYANSGAIGDAGSCSFDNPRYRQWRQSRLRDNSRHWMRGFLNSTPVTSCRPYVKKIRRYITTMRNIHFTDIITRGFRYITVSITRYRTKIREEKAKALVWLSSESINPQKIPHNSPLRASYGASFWVFVWKIGARCR